VCDATIFGLSEDVGLEAAII